MLLGALVGGAATVVGGGMSMVGGAMSLAGGLLHAGSTITSIGAGAVGGLASAAGGMLGGGESGNVQREDGGGERVYGAERFGSKINTAKTPGGSSKAIVIPQTSMLGSQSTALASTETSQGSSPQEVLMSIFKSMQQSLSSIDNTLRSMLNVDTATLAMEQKSATQDKLNAQDTDARKEKGPGFFSRVGSKAKGAVNRIMPSSGGAMSKALKLVGLGAMIALFNKYQDQITSAIAKVIGYFVDLEKEFQAGGGLEDPLGGFASVFNKITGDLSTLGEKVMPVLKSFWEDTVKPKLVEFFTWVITQAKDIFNKIIDPTGPPVDPETGEAAKKLNFPKTELLLQTLSGNYANTDTEKYNKNLATAQSGGEARTITTGMGEIDVSAEQSMLNSMIGMTTTSRGKVTWSKDLNDKSIPIEERIAAKPMVEGKEYELDTIPDLSKVPFQNFDEVNPYPLLSNVETKSGSYKSMTDTEAELYIRQQIANHQSAKQLGNDAFDGLTGTKYDRDQTIVNLEQSLRQLNPDAKIVPYEPMGNNLTKDQMAEGTNFKNKQMNNTAEINRLVAQLETEKNNGGTNAVIAPVTNNQTNVSNNTQGQTRHPRSQAMYSAYNNLTESRFTDN